MPNEYKSELSPSEDIVERLRKFSAPTGGGAFCPREMAKEAADEIERLREWNREIGINAKWFASEVERLREALRQIADADAYDENGKPNGGGYFINLARATLGEKK